MMGYAMTYFSVMNGQLKVSWRSKYGYDREFQEHSLMLLVNTADPTMARFSVYSMDTYGRGLQHQSYLTYTVPIRGLGKDRPDLPPPPTV